MRLCGAPPSQRGESVRQGYTLVELVVSIGAASILMLGMGSAVMLSAEAFQTNETPVGRRVDTTQVQQQILNDLRYARSFSERTANAVTFTVPDRTGNGRPDTIRYAWSGTAGDPLTYSLNGSTPVELAASVNQFSLTFQTQTLNAPVIPEEADSSPATILFVSGGQMQEVEQSLLDLLNPSLASEYVEPTEGEQKRLVAFEAAGYSIVRILDEASNSDVEEALAAVDAVYISGEIDPSVLSDLYRKTTLGVVNEHDAVAESLGFCGTTETNVATSLTVVTNDHHITADQPVGPLFISPSIQFVMRATPPFAPGLQSLISTDLLGEPYPCLMAMNAGGETVDGSATPGRRVQLPLGFDSFDYDAVTDQTRKVILTSIDWALGNGNDGTPNVVVPEFKFGYDTIFASSLEGRRKQFATQVALAETGVATSLSVYIGGASSDVRMAIYTDDGGQPGKLLAETNVGSSSNAMAWLTLPVSKTTLPPGDYWLAVSFDSRNQKIRIQPGGQMRVFDNRATAGGFTNEWGTSSTLNEASISIYATYETPN